jgi:hypothetical protein
LVAPLAANHQALRVGELDYHGYAVLSFLVDVIDLPGHGSEAIYTLEGLAAELGWPHTTRWLGNKLHELRREGWIDFDGPRRGPEAPWVFRLSGAAIDAERDEFRMSFEAETPSQFEIDSNRRPAEQAVNPHPDGVSDAPELRSAEARRAEQSETFSEEKLDHVLGETTARVSVERAEDGSLLWNGEPQEGEQGLLDDCQAFVNAGVAGWREKGEL